MENGKLKIMKKIVLYTLLLLCTVFAVQNLAFAEEQTKKQEQVQEPETADTDTEAIKGSIMTHFEHTLKNIVGGAAESKSVEDKSNETSKQQTPIITSPMQLMKNAAIGAPPTVHHETVPHEQEQIGKNAFWGSLISDIGKVIGTVDAIIANVQSMENIATDFRVWLEDQQNSERRVELLNRLKIGIVTIILIPLGLALLVGVLLFPLRKKYRTLTPDTMLEKVSMIVVFFVLRIVPIVIFLCITLILLNDTESRKLYRFIMLNIVLAISMGFVIQQILRGFFAPHTPQLRIAPLTTEQAVSAYRWSNTFNLFIVYVTFFSNIINVKFLEVPHSIIITFQSLVSIVFVVLAVIAIIKSKNFITKLIRGDIADNVDADTDTEVLEENLSTMEYIRWKTAAHGYKLAIAYLIFSLGLVLLGGEEDRGIILTRAFLTAGIFLALVFGLLFLSKWKSRFLGKNHLMHRRVLLFLLKIMLFITAFALIGKTWGFDIAKVASTYWRQQIIGISLAVLLPFMGLVILYEIIHRAIEKHLNARDKVTKQLMASTRTKTLLPMMRTSIFVCFSIIMALICLSAFGVNVGPLLAGAGIIGVAIGFGSQSLVKDFLTGIFIVTENTVAVEDIVRITDSRRTVATGTVEALTIRTIRIRDIEGSLHIIPFSEVTTVINMTKSFAFAMVDLRVSYKADLEKVMQAIREVGAEVQEDPVFKRVILEPIEIMGVNNLDTYYIEIRVRMRVRAGKQVSLKRLLLLKIKQKFDKEGIEIPLPTNVEIRRIES